MQSAASVISNLEPQILNFESLAISREDQLLLLSARLTFDPETNTRFKKVLTSNLDWEKLLQNAKRLGASPLLHKHLSHPQWRDAVPTYVLQTLKEAYRKSAIQALRIQGQIKQVSNQAAASEIPIIFLKGAALSGSLYQDIALRPMGDIDFLCREKDIAKVDRMLRHLGYYQDFDICKSSVHKLISNENAKHLTPYNRKNTVSLEVHKRLIGKQFCGQIKMEQVWNDAIQTKEDESYPRTLNHEWMLLHLCVHLNDHLKNGGFTLYWLSDVVGYVSRFGDEVKWDKLFKLAGEFAVQEGVQNVLSFIHAYYELTIPHPAIHNDSPVFKELKVVMNVNASKAVIHENLIETKFEEFKSIALTYGAMAASYYWFRKLFPKKAYILNKHGETVPWKFLCLYLSNSYGVLRNAAAGMRMKFIKT